MQMLRSFYSLVKWLQNCSHQTTSWIMFRCLCTKPVKGRLPFFSARFLRIFQQVNFILKYYFWTTTDGVLEITLRNWIPHKTKQTKKQTTTKIYTKPSWNAVQKCVGKCQSQVLNTFWKLSKSIIIQLNTENTERKYTSYMHSLILYGFFVCFSYFMKILKCYVFELHGISCNILDDFDCWGGLENASISLCLRLVFLT